MPPTGSDQYLQAMARIKDWRYDPRLAEEYSAAQRQFDDRHLGQLAQMGQITAQGIADMGNIGAQGISGAFDSYSKGQQLGQEREAHQRRMALSEENLEDMKADRAFMNGPSSSAPGAPSRRDRMNDLKMQKAEEEVNQLKKGRKGNEAVAWSSTNQTDENGYPIMFNRLTGEYVSGKVKVKQKPNADGRAIMMDTVDEKGNPIKKGVVPTAGLVVTPPPKKTDAKQEYDALPPEKQQQIKTIATKVGNYKAAASTVKSGLVEFQKAKTKDEKIRIGQGMLKEMNSMVGSDAVGAEEVKRLGNALEYQIANFTGPGPVMGRDLKGFEKQAFSSISHMENAAGLAQNEIDYLYNRAGSQAAQSPVDPNLRSPGSALAAPGPQTPMPSPSDVDAMNFVRDNPDDPRTPALLAKLKRKGLI